MMKKISVVIPTYNRAKQIKQAIHSVLSQTYHNFEILVVDDGSTDETENIVNSIQDKRVRYIKLLENSGGPAFPRNVGAEKATGPVVAFLDSDDRWLEYKLEHQMRFWERHPEYSMIYCPYFMCKGDKVIGITPGENIEREQLSGDILLPLLKRNTVGAPTMMIRKENFYQCGGYDTSYRCLEDWEFVLRFASRFRIGFLDEILVEANYSQGSVSSRIDDYFDCRCRMIAGYKKELWENRVFDQVVEELFQKAASFDMLPQVKKLLGGLLLG